MVTTSDQQWNTYKAYIIYKLQVGIFNMVQSFDNLLHNRQMGHRDIDTRLGYKN